MTLVKIMKCPEGLAATVASGSGGQVVVIIPEASEIAQGRA